MVGIYGTIEATDEFNQVREHFYFTENEYTSNFKENNVSIHGVFHEKKEAKSQPIEQNDIHLFVLGEICGYGNLKKYVSKKNAPKNSTDAEFCMNLYKKHSMDFVKNLNSNFVCVIIDKGDSKTHIITDRLGSIPLYYTKLDDQSFIFSTSLQAIARHSRYDIAFDKKNLCQYLTIYRVLGKHTPLKNIKKVHPASILTFDHKKGKVKEEVYWKPDYKPMNKSFQFFKDWFSQIFDDVMNDRIYDNKDYGLFLSGGTDSRLIAHYLKGEKTFHINDSLNREAKIARKIASISENEFVFLQRDLEYYPRLLKAITPHMNFNAPFQSPHHFLFKEEFKNLTLLHGLYGDTMLLGHAIPSYKNKSPFPSIPSPMEINKVKEYLNWIDKNSPEYINLKYRKSTIIDEKEFKMNNVAYGNLENIIQYGIIYPLTNKGSTLYYEALNHLAPTCHPYLDNRIIEISQYLPMNYKLRRDIVRETLYNKNKNLSKVMYPTSLIPAHHDKLIHGLFSLFHSKLDKLIHHMEGQGSWADYYKVIRKTGYAEDLIKNNKDTLDSFDYLDYNKSLEMVQNADKYPFRQIHALLSFLKINENIIR